MTALLCDWGGCCALGLRDLSWCFPCTLFGRLSSAQYSSETTNTNRIMFPLKLQLCPRGIHKVDLDPFLSITHKVADICILYPAFSLVKSKAHIIPSVEPTASIWYQSGVFSSFFFFLFVFISLLNSEAIKLPESEAIWCSVNWWSLISHGAEPYPIISHNFMSSANSLDLKRAFPLFVLLP